MPNFNFYLLLLICVLYFSLDHFKNEKLSKTYKKEWIQELKKDSLRSKTYEELESNYKKFKEDSLLANIYIDEYLLKAKREKDTFHLSEGYCFKSMLVKKNRDIAVVFADSAINISINLKNSKFPTKALIYKAGHLYYKGNSTDALQNFLIAKTYAEKNNDFVQLIKIQQSVAVLKKSLGKNEEALQIFKKLITIIEDQKFETSDNQLYLNSLLSISDTYNRLHFTDSAIVYIKKGMTFSKGKNSIYRDFLLAYGINRYIDGNYKNALDTLKKSYILFRDQPGNMNTPITQLYLAKSYNQLNVRDSAFKYLTKIDDHITEKNYTPEVREGFEMLIKYYERMSDPKNQLRVLEKLIKLDSLSYSKNEELNTNIIRLYDTQNLINEKNNLINSINSQKTSLRRAVIIVSGFGALFLFLLFYHRRKQKMYKSKFDEIIKTMENQYNTIQEDVPSAINQKLDLPQEIINTLKIGLTQFEESKGFLDKSLTLSSLAIQLNTNSSYLSKIINFYKKKNFTNYLNDLRVDYTIQQLNEESKFRKYSIKSIAGEVGFNNERSFSRAFYKKLGVYPSFYIKELNVLKSNF